MQISNITWEEAYGKPLDPKASLECAIDATRLFISEGKRKKADHYIDMFISKHGLEDQRGKILEKVRRV